MILNYNDPIIASVLQQVGTLTDVWTPKGNMNQYIHKHSLHNVRVWNSPVFHSHLTIQHGWTSGNLFMTSEWAFRSITLFSIIRVTTDSLIFTYAISLVSLLGDTRSFPYQSLSSQWIRLVPQQICHPGWMSFPLSSGPLLFLPRHTHSDTCFINFLWSSSDFEFLYEKHLFILFTIKTFVQEVGDLAQW